MQKRLIIDDAASLLSTQTTPAVFLDTCVMLDIFRVVDRANDFMPFKTYLLFAEKVKKGDVVVIYNETVENEFAYNSRRVVNELISRIQNLNRSWNAFRSMKDKKAVGHRVTLSDAKILQVAERTLRTIRKDAIIIKDYDVALWSSYYALLNHIAPAERDSQFKDAYIFKTCLDVARKSGRQIIFCSSNTKDYCDDKKRVHPDISSQANANNVIVTLSLGEAYGRL